MLGSLAMPKHQWEFVTAYYRITRDQALRVAAVIGGEFPIKYCYICENTDHRKVQAMYSLTAQDRYLCDHHNKEINLPSERIW